MKTFCALVCLALAVVSCAATSKAGQRRMAEARNKWCGTDLDCRERTREWCASVKLERTCGEGADYDYR